MYRVPVLPALQQQFEQCSGLGSPTVLDMGNIQKALLSGYSAVTQGLLRGHSGGYSAVTVCRGCGIGRQARLRWLSRWWTIAPDASNPLFRKTATHSQRHKRFPRMCASGEGLGVGTFLWAVNRWLVPKHYPGHICGQPPRGGGGAGTGPFTPTPPPSLLAFGWKVPRHGRRRRPKEILLDLVEGEKMGFYPMCLYSKCSVF